MLGPVPRWLPVPGSVVPILCSPGTYCDIGSATETACEQGTHSNVSGLASREDCETCPPGYWCNGGTRVACSEATYNPHEGGGSTLDCKSCPAASTTLAPAATSASDCVCVQLYYNSGSNASQGPVCTECPLGARCDTAGVTIATLELLPGYWRQGVNATALFRCPDAAVLSSGCQGGTGNPCKPSLHGPFCTLCVDDSLYYDDSECKTCNAQNLLNSTNIVLIVFLLTVLSSTIGCAITNKRAGHSQSRHAHRAGVQGARREARRMLRRLHRWQMVASRMSLSVKMRLVISFFQVVCRAPKVRRVPTCALHHCALRSLRSLHSMPSDSIDRRSFRPDHHLMLCGRSRIHPHPSIARVGLPSGVPGRAAPFPGEPRPDHQHQLPPSRAARVPRHQRLPG